MRCRVPTPEVQRLLDTRISRMCPSRRLWPSFFLADKRPLVVAGTHGKTTTTALLAWVLERAGLQPSFPGRRAEPEFWPGLSARGRRLLCD